MKKGKSGIFLNAIGIVVFILAFFAVVDGWTVCVALLLATGFAIAVEKEGWLNKQVLQALFMFLGARLVLFGIDCLFGTVYTLSGMALNGPGLVVLQNILVGCVDLAVLIFTLIAVVRLSRGKDAALPLFGSLANKSMGIFPIRPQSPYPGQPQYWQPQNPGYQQPGASQPVNTQPHLRPQQGPQLQGQQPANDQMGGDAAQMQPTGVNAPGQPPQQQQQ